jgi:hypothetical protein
MASISSFGDLNSGLQAAVINRNFTAQFRELKPYYKMTSLIANTALGQAKSSDQECLRALRTTDPRHDKERLKDTNGGPLNDCYRWIVDNQEFKQW